MKLNMNSENKEIGELVEEASASEPHEIYIIFCGIVFVILGALLLWTALTNK